MKERYDPDKDIKRLPDGSTNVWAYLTKNGRDRTPLGTNADGSRSSLEPYVDIDGVQIHPERLEQYFQQLAEAEKKDALDPDDYSGILGVLRRYLGL